MVSDKFNRILAEQVYNIEPSVAKTNNSTSMEEAVKGKFGTKIKESLETQKNFLNDL
ncbi:hypothetical protein ACR3IL_09535 [Streptococcus iniae]